MYNRKSEKNKKYGTRERKEDEDKTGIAVWDHRNLGRRKFLHGDNVNVFTLDSVLVWRNLKITAILLYFWKRYLVSVKTMGIINLKNDNCLH